MSSKERRRALRNIQGPRSRASLAAPPTHSSLQSNHMGLGGTYSSALEDWLMTKHKTSNSITHFPLSDSVPDLTGFNENCNGSGISTNHSTPQKMHYHHHQHQHNNNSRYTANANGYPLVHNSSYTNGFSVTPTRTAAVINNKNDYAADVDDNDVQLRRVVRRCENGNEKDEWMYRRPLGPNDIRHSCKYLYLYIF